MKLFMHIKWRLIFIIFLEFTSNFGYAKDLYIRGQILHFLDDPYFSENSYQHIEDGLLIVSDNKIRKIGEYNNLKKTIPADAHVTYYKEGLILPGFIDTHTHYPQLDMIAANSGGQLLQWLNNYTFPFEKKFNDHQYATEVANFFLDEMIRNGTTSAMIFTTIYPDAVDSLFSAAQTRHMRIIAGQVMGDKNLPAHLIQSPEIASAQTIQLINKWHNKPDNRILYAITFRFAPSTSQELFQKISELKQSYPDVYIHTHISENKMELNWANELFDTENYLEIYDRYDLLGEHTLLAHGVFLTDKELARMHATNIAVAFCPTSNLFLGSGLFDFEKAEKNKLIVGLGTDIGAGTSFSMLQTLGDAYKVLQLQGQNLSSLEGFYLATLGGARALGLDEKLGNFKPGKEADFVVLNLAGGTPLLQRRLSYAKTLSDKLFVLMTLGDDRSVIATYIDGRLAYSNQVFN